MAEFIDGRTKEESEMSQVFLEVPSAAALLAFTADVVQLLYEDIGSGRLTGENTVPSKSCADFIDAVELALSRHGIKPRLEEPSELENFND